MTISGIVTEEFPVVQLCDSYFGSDAGQGWLFRRKPPWLAWKRILIDLWNSCSLLWRSWRVLRSLRRWFPPCDSVWNLSIRVPPSLLECVELLVEFGQWPLVVSINTTADVQAGSKYFTRLLFSCEYCKARNLQCNWDSAGTGIKWWKCRSVAIRADSMQREMPKMKTEPGMKIWITVFSFTLYSNYLDGMQVSVSY